MDEKLLSVADMCALLKVSDDTVYRMIKEGSLVATKARRRWRILPDSVMTAVAAELNIKDEN